MRLCLSENTTNLPLPLIWSFYGQKIIDCRSLTLKFWRHYFSLSPKRAVGKSTSIVVPWYLIHFMCESVFIFYLEIFRRFLFQIHIDMCSPWALAIWRYLPFGFVFLLWSFSSFVFLCSFFHIFYYSIISLLSFLAAHLFVLLYFLDNRIQIF